MVAETVRDQGMMCPDFFWSRQRIWIQLLHMEDPLGIIILQPNSTVTVIPFKDSEKRYLQQDGFGESRMTTTHL